MQPSPWWLPQSLPSWPYGWGNAPMPTGQIPFNPFETLPGMGRSVLPQYNIDPQPPFETLPGKGRSVLPQYNVDPQSLPMKGAHYAAPAVNTVHTVPIASPYAETPPPQTTVAPPVANGGLMTVGTPPRQPVSRPPLAGSFLGGLLGTGQPLHDPFPFQQAILRGFGQLI